MANNEKKILAELLQFCLKANAPYDTGNLAINSIRIMYDTDGEVFVAIGGEIAPYAVYTNEKWISPKWNGKKNPNEKWIERSIEEAIPIIEGYVKKSIPKTEVTKQKNLYKKAFEKRQEERMKKL